MTEHQTIKIRRETYRKIKRLAARRPESIVELIDRLVDTELQKDTDQDTIGNAEADQGTTGASEDHTGKA